MSAEQDGEKARAMHQAHASVCVNYTTNNERRILHARYERNARSGSLLAEGNLNIQHYQKAMGKNQGAVDDARRNSRSRAPVDPERAHLKDTRATKRTIIIKAFTLYQRAGVIHRRRGPAARHHHVCADWPLSLGTLFSL